MKNTADCPFEEKNAFAAVEPLCNMLIIHTTHRIQIEALDDKMNELKK